MSQGDIVRGVLPFKDLVSANRWLRGIRTYSFPWYLTPVSANDASSNRPQRSADFVRKQLKDLSKYIGNPIQSVLTSPKIGEQLLQERKPPLLSRQYVAYQFNCDLCDTDCIGYTTRHLHQRIEEAPEFQTPSF